MLEKPGAEDVRGGLREDSTLLRLLGGFAGALRRVTTGLRWIGRVLRIDDHLLAVLAHVHLVAVHLVLVNRRSSGRIACTVHEYSGWQKTLSHQIATVAASRGHTKL